MFLCIPNLWLASPPQVTLALGFDSGEIQMTQQKEQRQPLFLFLWLPAGKDKFGASDSSSKNLSEVVTSHNTHEQRINRHVINIIAKLNQNDNIYSNTYITDPNQELGCKVFKIGFEFTFTPELKPSENLCGQLYIYSHGLYMWRVDLQDK